MSFRATLEALSVLDSANVDGKQGPGLRFFGSEEC